MEKIRWTILLTLIIGLGFYAPTWADEKKEFRVCAEGKYALCAGAPCEMVNGVAICSCPILDAAEFPTATFISCENIKNPGYNTVYSTYSFNNNAQIPLNPNGMKTLRCEGNQKYTWANCGAAVCSILDDQTSALCVCPDVRHDAFQTIGGDCQADACNQVWSGYRVIASDSGDPKGPIPILAEYYRNHGLEEKLFLPVEHCTEPKLN